MILGYVSHRYAGGEKSGSWFIQTFVDVIQNYQDALKSKCYCFGLNFNLNP